MTFYRIGIENLTGVERTLRRMRKLKSLGLCTSCGELPGITQGARKKIVKWPVCERCRDRHRQRKRKYPEGTGRQRLSVFADFLRLSKRSRTALGKIMSGKKTEDYATKRLLQRKGLLDGDRLSGPARRAFVLSRCGVAVFKQVLRFHEVKCKTCTQQQRETNDIFLRRRR